MKGKGEWMKVKESLLILGGALVDWLAADGAPAPSKLTDNQANGLTFGVSAVF